MLSCLFHVCVKLYKDIVAVLWYLQSCSIDPLRCWKITKQFRQNTILHNQTALVFMYKSNNRYTEQVKTVDASYSKSANDWIKHAVYTNKVTFHADLMKKKLLHHFCYQKDCTLSKITHFFSQPRAIIHFHTFVSPPPPPPPSKKRNVQFCLFYFTNNRIGFSDINWLFKSDDVDFRGLFWFNKYVLLVKN